MRVAISRFVMLMIALGLLFFLLAWANNYWQALVYIPILIMPAIVITLYLYKYDPELMERRLRRKERQKTQRLIQARLWPFFLLVFIVPVFDSMLNWSHVPTTIVIISDALVLSGYWLMWQAFRVNSWASRIVEVEKGQKVIATGTYSFVRHPMYLGILVMFIFSPLALGSYWALIPASLIVPVLLIRIRDEEKELLENLEGYREYAAKTKYHLIPGIW